MTHVLQQKSRPDTVKVQTTREHVARVSQMKSRPRLSLRRLTPQWRRSLPKSGSVRSGAARSLCTEAALDATHPEALASLNNTSGSTCVTSPGCQRHTPLHIAR